MSKQFNNFEQRAGGGYGGDVNKKSVFTIVSDEDLFKPYSIEGFFEDKGVVRSELICDIGKNNVKELALRLARGDENANDKPLKVNQLRKFYDSYVRIIRANIPDDEKKVQLLMFSANARYSGNSMRLKLLRLFIEQRIKYVLQAPESQFNKTCEAFKLHFEALVAYFPKKEKEEA